MPREPNGRGLRTEHRNWQLWSSGREEVLLCRRRRRGEHVMLLLLLLWGVRRESGRGNVWVVGGDFGRESCWGRDGGSSLQLEGRDGVRRKRKRMRRRRRCNEIWEMTRGRGHCWRSWVGCRHGGRRRRRREVSDVDEGRGQWEGRRH